MKTVRAKLLFLVGTLVLAFVSFTILSLPWHRLTTEGRSFTVYFGVVPSLPFVDSVPYSWPFAVAAFLYRYLIGSWPVSLRWALAVGAAGVIVHCLVSRVQFVGSEPILLSSYIGVYMRHAFPLLYSLTGFLLGHLYALNRNA